MAQKVLMDADAAHGQVVLDLSKLHAMALTARAT
jgi:hypothetical protein